MPYRSPAAFRRALTDKLRELAKGGKWTLPQLQRQMAYDRAGRTQSAADNAMGIRVPVTAYVGQAIWAQFHVDLLGQELKMTGEPENVPPLARVAMPDVEQHGYRAYPLVDHVADKIVATIQRYGDAEIPSTRYKDLVDLVAIISEASVGATAQSAALKSEAKRRGVVLPQRFSVPDWALWEPGYAAEARRSLLPLARTLGEALEVVTPFVNPLLDGTAQGAWSPEGRTWSL